MKRKNIQSAHLSAVERRGHKVMQRRKRENEKRKQDERQQTGKESERHGGVWGKVRSTKKEPDRSSVNQAAR